MRSANKNGFLWIRVAIGIAVLAGGFLATTGCEEDLPGVLNAAGQIGAGATGDYFYGFTESDGNGGTRSFSLSPATSARESLETYLSDSIVY